MDKREIKQIIIRWGAALILIFAIGSLIAEEDYQEDYYSEYN